MSDALAFFDKHLGEFISERYPQDTALNQAIAYALGGGGKRVRPICTILSCEALGGSREQSLSGALAVEMVHAYSLIHDDLPCIDNDALRRGRPTVHIAFGEATALLAGDALLTDSFHVLAESSGSPTADQAKLRQTAELSRAAGSKGMVMGQCLDLYWTDRTGASKDILDMIHLKKTGALLGAACALGAIAGGANMQTQQIFRKFGENIGLAFQILDDLLDDSEGIGKSQGKDAAANKLTYLKMMSPTEARKVANILTDNAIASIKPCCRSDEIIRFANALLSRKN